MRATLQSIGIIALGFSLACGDDPAPAPRLRTGVAEVCDPDAPLVLDLLASGVYELNRNRMDSAMLAQWFQEHLAKRPRPGQILMVRVDSTRVTDLRWIIPAIERVGGAAYELDTACAPPRASSRPAA
jgi:hypothetical protein